MFQLKVSSQYYAAPIGSTHISSLVARFSTECLHVALLYEKQKSVEGAYMPVMLKKVVYQGFYDMDN